MQVQGLLSGTAPPCRNQMKHHSIPAALAQRLCPRVSSNSLACTPSSAYNVRQRVQAVAASATLEDLSASSSKDQAESSGSAPSAKSGVDAVPLTSEAGRDYTELRDALKAGEFEKADDITRNELIQLAGPNAAKRNWVYFTEVKFIPDQDLQTIDALWKAASGGKFGYSVQREVWMQQSKYWSRFFKKIEWVQGENNVYKKWPMEFTYSTDAPKGHLPLTNALRGTQLIQAIFEHPAFDRKGESSNGAPSWMK